MFDGKIHHLYIRTQDINSSKLSKIKRRKNYRTQVESQRQNANTKKLVEEITKLFFLIKETLTL